MKPMQVSSQVAKKASSDGTTNKQGRAAHRQSTRMTVDKLHTDFADFADMCSVGRTIKIV